MAAWKPYDKLSVVDAAGNVVGKLTYVAHEDEADEERPLSYGFSPDSVTAVALYKVTPVRYNVTPVRYNVSHW